MIILDKFVVSDMPKSAGTFIRKAYGIPADGSYRHLYVQTDKPKYLFVRDALSWYVSFLSFIKNGSTHPMHIDKPLHCIVASLLNNENKLSVDNYLRVLLGQDIEIRKQLCKLHTMVLPPVAIYRHIVEWAKSDIADLYSWMIDYYSKNTINLQYSDLSSGIVALANKYNQEIKINDLSKKESVTFDKITLPRHIEEELRNIPTVPCISLNDI